MLRDFKGWKKETRGKVRHNRAAQFSDKQYKCENTSDRKAHRKWKSRIAWKQHKEDILFIHCKPCVVLSELGVGVGGRAEQICFCFAIQRGPPCRTLPRLTLQKKKRQTAKWGKCKRTWELCITPQLEDTKAWLTGKQAVAFPLACVGWIPFSTQYLFRRQRLASHWAEVDLFTI